MDKKPHEHRIAIMLNARGENLRFSGSEVYSITEKGIVISKGTYRTLYPWARVAFFTYHHDDESARKTIQGW